MEVPLAHISLFTLLTTSAAGDVLGLSPRTLETLRVRGGGPAFIKLGSSVRYEPQALQDWIDANRAVSTSDTHE